MKLSLMASITIDGFISKNIEESSLNWTTREDTKFFVKKTKEAGYLIMGSKTFETIEEKHLPFKERTIIVLSNSKEYGQYHSDQVRVESGTPKEVYEKLESEGINEVVLAGGSSVYTQFINENLVDDLFITVESVAFGDGVKLFNQKVNVKLILIEVIDLSDQTKVFHYKVEN